MRGWGSVRGSPPLRLLFLDEFLLARAIPQVIRAVGLAQVCSGGVNKPDGGDAMDQRGEVALGALECARNYGVLTVRARTYKVRQEIYD